MELDEKRKGQVCLFVEESFNALNGRDEQILHKCYDKGISLYNNLPDSPYKEQVAIQLCHITEQARQEERLRELIPYLELSTKESVHYHAIQLKILSYRRTNEQNKELQALNELVSFSLSTSKDQFIAESHLMLGDFFYHHNQNDEAFKLYSEGLYHAQCSHNKSLEANGKIRLGLIWMNEDKLGLALDEFLEAEELSADSYDHFIAYKTTILRAYCKLILCRTESAKAILKDAVNIIETC